MLFQAVLYGNGPVPDMPIVPFELPPPAPYVAPYWVTVEGKGSSCVEAFSPEAAGIIAESILGAPVLAVDRLPYPAAPRLNPYEEYPGHGVCPSFCYQPWSCKGRSCCPNRISCVE